jgi:hypothetical protein
MNADSIRIHLCYLWLNERALHFLWWQGRRGKNHGSVSYRSLSPESVEAKRFHPLILD